MIDIITTFTDPLIWLMSIIRPPHPHRYADVIELLGMESVVSSLDVNVILGILPPGWWGAFSAHDRTVTMRPGLTPAQFRSVLGHELGHAKHGHGFSAAGSDQERIADRFAAKSLIRMDDYNEARRQFANDIAAMAEFLGVMPWVVREYADTMSGAMFARVGTGAFTGRPPFTPVGTDGSGADRCIVTNVTPSEDSNLLILGNNVLR